MILTCTGLDASGIPVWVNRKGIRIEIPHGTVMLYDDNKTKPFWVTYIVARNPTNKEVVHFLWDGRDDGFATVGGKERVDYTPQTY